MAELYPAPFSSLLRRMYRELAAQDSIFDLRSKFFFRGDPELDTSVIFHGRPAATPVGPAAGPQSQLAQNIVVSWLAGARIFELKTVQILDRLEIPRPCIHAPNLGFNVEWSQELRLEDSVREYVKASMMIDLLRADLPGGGLPGGGLPGGGLPGGGLPGGGLPGGGLPGGGLPGGGRLAGERPGPQKDATLYDMSVGYDLKGIQSPRITNWIRSLQDASALVDELRVQIPPELKFARDFPFETRVSKSITLSTLHGCPADEIERIADFLLSEMGVDVVVKVNPTLLGKATVDHLLHDVMGYHELQTANEVFEKDLQFPDALDIFRRLHARARQLGRSLGVKFTNILAVRNHLPQFKDEMVYLSGPPLHVMSLTLAEKFRRALDLALEWSFSAGIDRQNFPDAVACGLTPITTCTDLLKTGGYGRLSGYVNGLEARMRELGVRNVADYVIKAEGLGEPAVRSCLGKLLATAARQKSGLGDLGTLAVESVGSLERALLAELESPRSDLARVIAARRDRLAAALGTRSAAAPLLAAHDELHRSIARCAGLANMVPSVARAQTDPRYRKEQNTAYPKKVGSALKLFDCLNCDKCIPVCPNDANFSVESGPVEMRYRNLQLSGGELLPSEELTFKVGKSKQIANFSDFCNECGNCDTYCPEDGGPYLVKPRFFGSLEAFRRHGGHDGFHVEQLEAGFRMLGRIGGRDFTLETGEAEACFDDGTAQARLRLDTGEVLSSRLLRTATPGHLLDLSRFFIMRAVLEGVTSGGRVNPVNAGWEIR
jgi:putative selenate reductase